MPVVFRVAVPVPLPKLFDYLPPGDWDGVRAPIGARVLVPWARRSIVGCVLDCAASSELPVERLRSINRILDSQPLLANDDLRLLRWAADYYHYPIGEVLAAAFPGLLRHARSAEEAERRYALTETGRMQNPEAIKRAPRQRQLLAWLHMQTQSVNSELLDSLDRDWRPTLRSLINKGWVEVFDSPIDYSPIEQGMVLRQAGPRLNQEQDLAITTVAAALGGFQPFLLEGVTGSGKTEVYLRLIETALQQGGQVLVLLPEIALTPQLEARFAERFAVPIGVFHSGLTDTERLRVWLAAQRGRLPILLGTRSAVFTPMPNLRLILVDEEHDPSFKQQEGFRLHARDVAVMRARLSHVPIVLGSATPSLESCFNAQRGRYHRLLLSRRAGDAVPPLVRLLDLRNLPLDAGLSPALQHAVAQVLEQGNQVLLFLNRRGFAPVLICHACGWVGRCQRCDANFVVHAADKRLRCHHCGADKALFKRCPSCASDDLRSLGQGTERVEQILRGLYPGVGIARVDRDSIRRKGALQQVLENVHSGRVQLLLGTQMLAKGHHFPNVTLVGVLDVDSGLYSVDFRSGERLAQLIVQVAGRAGRGDKPGTVLLQTHCPEHPLLHVLLQEGYSGFTREALLVRQAARLPPFTFQALLRAESTERTLPQAFFQQLGLWVSQQAADVIALGPAPAPRERLAGRYRWQLLLQSPRREALHRLLNALIEYVETLPASGKPRWSVDVDPVDLS